MNGPELREFRKRRGWTQKQLSDLIDRGLEKNWKNAAPVGRWENGKVKIPTDVDAFLTSLALEEPDFTITDDGREVLFEHEPGDSPPPPPGPSAEDAARNVAALVGGGSYARICEELWELVATGVGMVGAVTGSKALQRDGEIILSDKQALGKAYGKLAEQNATFRSMLIGMSGGGAWLEVALVSGITAGKVMRNHQPARPVVMPLEEVPAEEPEVMRGDGAVIDFGR